MIDLSQLQKTDPTIRFRYDPQLDVVRHLRGQLSNHTGKTRRTPKTVGLGFVKKHAELFGNVDVSHTRVLEETPDRNGGTSVTLQQYHGKYPVMGGSIRFHLNRNGQLDTVSNRLFPDLKKLPKRARVTEDKAVRIAQAKLKCKTEPARKPELLVFRHDEKPRLAWRIQLNDTRPGERGVPAQWIAFVDAINGKILFWYDNIQTAGPVVGTGTGVYSGGGPVAAWFNDLTNQLRDTTRTAIGGPEIVTNDQDGASPAEDTDNNWSDLTATPRDQNQGAEVDAHRYTAEVIDYYQTVHGRNSFDGAGATPVTVVHVGNNYNNGYWDGTQVNLGDGDGVAWDYLTSDDWVAHEFTHAYTQYTCGLTYWAESGALNEAFSDIFAAFITGDWLVFEDTWLSGTAPAARNMMDPTNVGNWDNSSEAAAQASVLAGHQPSHWNDRYTGTWDNAGVHINSGIINHLFYLLTVGGTHATSGVTVTGIGQSPAEQMLFRCMSVNLVGNPGATMLDFREAMLDARQDLFPTDLNMLTQVKNAFNAVGIGPDIYVRDNVADTGLEPYGGSYLWASPDIINRTATVANPNTAFANLSDDNLWENVEYGQDNYIYVRLQNRANQSGDTTVNLYFSSATTFGTPASWTHIGTLTETAIAPGELRIGGPLTFDSALIPAAGHYCMIGVVSDSLDPAPDHTLISSVSDYLNFVRNTNNIAYRNMDVVDLVPGSTGTLAVDIQRMAGAREMFDVRLDVGQFIPGARLRIRGPAKALDGAMARGLKLVARNKQENVYEVLIGKDYERQRRFCNGMLQHQELGYGFDRLLLDRDSRIYVDYQIPERDILRRLIPHAPRGGFRIGLRQFWNGQEIGAVAHRLAPPKRQKKADMEKTDKPRRNTRHH